jgi:signal transduction histidine kinase
LTVRGYHLGALGVKDSPRDPLAPGDLELLDGIARQVAEALDSAQLVEQTRKRAVELETVSRVSAATATILETDKLLQAVVELTKRSFNLYHAHVYLLNQEYYQLQLAAGSGEVGDQMVRDGWYISLEHEHSIVARVAREREGLIVNDVRAEPYFLPNPLLPATRAEMAVPMIVGNRLMGVLDLQADETDVFSEEDVRIQTALANQIAVALQNAMLYQEQLKTAEQLREFDRLKSEFLASMSHELRTPLNSIIGFADVLLEGIDGELNERMEEDVRLIRSSGDHLRSLIGDILDMSKIEAGMMDLRYEVIDLPALARELESFARSQMLTYDKTLSFRVELSPEVKEVTADRTRLKQVLFNLISNAIKFTTEGEVRVEMARDDGLLEVAVVDTGIGIKADNLPIVFEQFRQLDGSLTRTAGGTGLGLPISRSLVELHGGEIYVESEVGEGTTFTFTLPVEGKKRRHETGPLVER